MDLNEIQKRAERMMDMVSNNKTQQVIIDYSDLEVDEKVSIREYIRDNFPESSYYEFVELIIQ